MRTFNIYAFAVRLNHVGSNVACNLQHTVVVVYSVVVVNRRLVKLILVGITTFLQFNDAFHQRMGKMELQFRIVSIIICHSYFEFCL